MSLNLRNALSNAFVGSGGGADATKLPLAGGTLTGPLTITGGTVTNSTPLLIMTQTWNDATDAFKFDTKAVTNTASKAYSSTWADVSTVNEVQVDGVAKFAFIPKGSENLAMLRIGGLDSTHPLLKDSNTGGLIFRRSDAGDLVNIGWQTGSIGVVVSRGQAGGVYPGVVGFSSSYDGQLSGGNGTADALFTRGAAAASIQMGLNHATTATHQTFKAHDVTTGVGADLILEGGAGSANDGYVKIGTATGGLAFFGAGGSLLISGNTSTNISSAGAGNPLLDDTQSDGGLAGGAYTFGGLVAALKSYGIIG